MTGSIRSSEKRSRSRPIFCRGRYLRSMFLLHSLAGAAKIYYGFVRGIEKQWQGLRQKLPQCAVTTSDDAQSALVKIWFGM